MCEPRTSLISIEESLLELWDKEKELDPKALSESPRFGKKYKKALSISEKSERME